MALTEFYRNYSAAMVQKSNQMALLIATSIDESPPTLSANTNSQYIADISQVFSLLLFVKHEKEISWMPTGSWTHDLWFCSWETPNQMKSQMKIILE